MAQSLPQKLLIKPGKTILLINTPPGYKESLRKLVDNEFVEKGPADIVQLFVLNKEELWKFIKTAMESAGSSGILWISYPKGSSKVKTDLNRDILWKEAEKYGLTGVTLISIDDTWSSMRFKKNQ